MGWLRSILITPATVTLLTCLRPFGPGRSAAGGVPNRKVIVLLAHDSSGKDLTVGSLPEIIDAHLAAGDTFGTLI